MRKIRLESALAFTSTTWSTRRPASLPWKPADRPALRSSEAIAEARSASGCAGRSQPVAIGVESVGCSVRRTVAWAVCRGPHGVEGAFPDADPGSATLRRVVGRLRP